MTRSRVTSSRRRAVEIITMLTISPSTPTAISIQPMVAHSTVVLPMVESSTTPNARIAPSAIKTIDVPIPMLSCLLRSPLGLLEAAAAEEAEQQENEHDDDDDPDDPRHKKRHSKPPTRSNDYVSRNTRRASPTNATSGRCAGRDTAGLPPA